MFNIIAIISRFSRLQIDFQDNRDYKSIFKISAIINRFAIIIFLNISHLNIKIIIK